MIRKQLAWLSTLAALLLLGSPPPAVADTAGRSRPPAVPAGWRLPLDGPVAVLRPFAPPPPGRPWLAGHRGIDLAAPAGAVVRAGAAGMVGFAGGLAGRSVVVVLHGPLRSTYEPVRPVVRVGQHVAVGEVIGRLEPLTTHCGQPCLHWGLLRGTTYLDPWPGRPSVRLLPFSAVKGSAPDGVAARAGPTAAGTSTAEPDRSQGASGLVSAGATVALGGLVGAGGVAWTRRRRLVPTAKT